jgi:Rieske Fe-S protein
MDLRRLPGRSFGEIVRMARCEVCGNEYDKSFEVSLRGETHVFDSFECAIHALAPTCEHCGCRIIGHGLEANGRMFCCASCAEQAGITGLSDRVDQ